MSLNEIVIKGARVNNLKNINVAVPRDKLVVFTGLSGSGKSSLAFDTIYAEGHRRFVESLSSYARMFLGQIDKPDVDLIEGLSPAVSIDQKTTSKNPRSTVGTVTEIYDYLRLMYSRIGIPHCPVCGKVIKQQTIDQIVDDIMTLPEGTRFILTAPVVRAKKGMHEKVFAEARKNGFTRARVDGEIITLDTAEDGEKLDKNKKHDVDIVVDRIVMKESVRGRVSDSAETALRMAGGNLRMVTADGSEERTYSQNYACEEHGFGVSELTPRMFSFNNPLGACEKCAGIGSLKTLSVDLVIPDRNLSIAGGAINVNGFKSIEDSTWTAPLYAAVGKKYGFTLDTPIKDYSPEALNVLLYGAGSETFEVDRTFDRRHTHGFVRFDGVLNLIEQRAEGGTFYSNQDYYDQFFEFVDCPVCKGRRLKDEILAVTVGGLNIDGFCRLPINDALDFVNGLSLTPTEAKIAGEIIKELRSRLGFLSNVGLSYLTLGRSAGTLSGGEAQRIRLATQIGSSLMGVLYILDEPSIGLHQRDNGKLIAALKSLRDLGNSVIVVEHDEETMLESDYIVDIGPGAGVRGGEVVACGTPEEIMRCENSITGQYLSGRKKIPVPASRRRGSGAVLTVHGATFHNLKNVDVGFPLGKFICVTGVSGSGKSSLVDGILYPVLAKKLNRATARAGAHRDVTGYEELDKVIGIDQSPIGRTPRSNPATYTGLFNDIRSLFASTNDAKIRGYGPGRFSFNVKGGRCEACQGDGVRCIEMHFLPDVYVTCDVCKGQRYNRDTLAVKYKGKSINDVLEMTVEEGVTFFENVPRISSRLRTLYDVGLGYIKIGQSSTTLSGGEAQRVKLATELSKRSTGRTCYILDEPTTGLHTDDVRRLVEILQRLTDQGNTVIVIEHNLELIKTCDYIIDMGPEGGEGGGTVIAAGTPEEVAEVPGSFTGQYLRKILNMKN
ncbi:MAG: excinuclease ABC subunit UvrA [Clostridia bacterium]|nr:excinuclease ABC subunit UvrA [Clostridia bacterium]